MKQISVHGYIARYEDSVYNGIRYLMLDLDREEAKVFFEQARMYHSAQFEDEYEGQYTITYNSSDGTYTLTKR